MEKMTAEQLKVKLTEQTEVLEELEEEKLYVFRQTGFHLPAGTVKKYEAEIENAKKQIELVKNILDSKTKTS